MFLMFDGDTDFGIYVAFWYTMDVFVLIIISWSVVITETQNTMTRG